MKKITRKKFIHLIELSAIATVSTLAISCTNSSASNQYLFGDKISLSGIEVVFSLWNQKNVPNHPTYSKYQNQKIISMYLFVNNCSKNITWVPCSTRDEYQNAFAQSVEKAFSLKSGFSCSCDERTVESTGYADKCLDPDIATVVTNIPNQFAPKESGTILVQTIVPSNWKQIRLKYHDQIGSFSYLLCSGDPFQIIEDTYD